MHSRGHASKLTSDLSAPVEMTISRGWLLTGSGWVIAIKGRFR